MKRVKYLQVRRPRVDLDCCYKIRQIDTKTGRHQDKYKQSITSSICKNASVNPNFEDPVVVFDVVSQILIVFYKSSMQHGSENISVLTSNCLIIRQMLSEIALEYLYFNTFLLYFIVMRRGSLRQKLIFLNGHLAKTLMATFY